MPNIILQTEDRRSRRCPLIDNYNFQYSISTENVLMYNSLGACKFCCFQENEFSKCVNTRGLCGKFWRAMSPYMGCRKLSLSRNSLILKARYVTCYIFLYIFFHFREPVIFAEFRQCFFHTKMPTVIIGVFDNLKTHPFRDDPLDTARGYSAYVLSAM